VVEAALELSGLPYRVEDFAIYDPARKAAERERLRAVNPLVQLPALILPDGWVMTESMAMVLHLADQAPEAGLAPPADAPERPRFLRWLAFIACSIYPMFTVTDDLSRWVTGADAQAELKGRVLGRRQDQWRQLEAAVDPDPWMLGRRMSALDLYVAAMNHWSPGRPWFADHCPKLTAVANAVAGHPKPLSAWARNFPPAS
jgi:GST-like protein